MKYFTWLLLLPALLFSRSLDFSYHTDGSNLFGHIKLERDRPISQSTYIEAKFALEDFVEKGVIAVILELDTPGGEVFSSLKISELLLRLDREHKIPVIAFIDNWAVSAGAMLAYSCRYIGCVPSSIMGAAEPVFQGKGGMESAPEKINSALRAEFSNLATYYGRNHLIAEAMVDKDLVVVKRAGEIIRLESNADIKRSDAVIIRAGKLLTLDSQELLSLGVADFSVQNDLFEEPFLAKIPNKKVMEYSDWKVSFFAFLSHPVVASLLMLALIIGFYIEMNTPGFGIAGSIATFALFLILLSNFAVYAVTWLEVIILALGVILLLLEIFVIPGFGVAGVLGIIFMLLGLFIVLTPALGKIHLFEPDKVSMVIDSILHRLAWLSGSLIVAAIIIALLARFVSPKFYAWTKLVLRGEQEGYTVQKMKMPKVGSTGVADSPLRPSGKVLIDTKLYDAITTGGFVEKGKKVTVVQARGNTVVIKES